jgi:hypothetical protein
VSRNQADFVWPEARMADSSFRVSSGGSRTAKTTATPFAESRGRPILCLADFFTFVYESI